MQASLGKKFNGKAIALVAAKNIFQKAAAEVGIRGYKYNCITFVGMAQVCGIVPLIYIIGIFMGGVYYYRVFQASGYQIPTLAVSMDSP